MNDIFKRIASLSPEQRALFEQRLKQKELNIKELNLKQIISIPKRKASDTLSLSLVQKRLWFLHQLQPDIPLYNESSLFRITGNLDCTVLEQSFNTIIQRHEILRTAFQSVDTQPIQIIVSILTIKLPIIDLQNLSATQQEESVKQIVTEQSSQSFDLIQAPLLRGTLIKLKQQEHIMLVTMHHIISDGWSWRVFYQELGTLYQAFSNNNTFSLPELPIQYADFALWQRQSLNHEACKSELAYWKQQLENLPPVLALPTDNPRPTVQSFRGAREPLILSASQKEALKSLSQKEGATLFMLLVAAFKTLLYRYTGQTDLVIGTPVANRNQIETENLLGCFVNTLVLRTDFSGNPSFRELLGRVRETTLAAYAHQNLQFEKLVQELQPERTLNYTPLFQVELVFQEAPLQALELPGLKLTPLIVDSGIAKFDLTLFLEDTKHGLMGALEYNTDLFKADTIKRMIGHFQTLLEGIVSKPDENISKLPLLTNIEQHQLIRDWNHSKIDYIDDSENLCIHQLFEAQVEQTPDAIAVVFDSERLTYQQLNQKANQLARYLQKLGIKPEMLVGICVERSLLMIVGILGILKAGGAYVPIDPIYPTSRQAFILEDAQIQILLSQQQLATKLPQNKARVICLDTDWSVIAQESTLNLSNNSVIPDNLAYVIYTSGSTGNPKGVLVNHANVVRLLLATQSWFNFNAQDVTTLFHSYAFDFSVWEIWSALFYGGRVVIVPYWISRTPQAFCQLLCEEGVTILNQTPSAFRQLIQEEEISGKTPDWKLRLVIFGGEALDIQSLRPWFGRHPDHSPQLVNMYGITETTVHVTYRPLTIADLSIPNSSVIGCPIPDLQIYILDKYNSPVPVGIRGEMHIGGVGLARGYLNRPELTSEKFIPNPFSDNPGARLYKSGDLARYLSNGDIEYLGRIDHQVKIRGFRIELGEIEAFLNQHPKIQTSIVEVHKDKVGSQHLVAYIVQTNIVQTNIAQTEQVLTITEIRRFLEDKLPSHMLPSTFMILEKLPLTSHGKVDRRALPVPDSTSRTQVEAAFTAPRNPIEEVVAGIWLQVLEVDRVGVHDNFFELGGHSLLATQVISRIQKTFEIDLPLRNLFEAPTVAELAKNIQKAIKKQLWQQSPPIERVKRNGNLPLSFAQERLWLVEQLNPGNFMYNMPAAISLIGELNIAVLEQSLGEIVRRHEILRTTFSVVDGQPFQVINPAFTFKLPVVDLQDLSPTEREVEVKKLTANEFQHTFDLTQDPLLRCTLLHLNENEYLALFTIHHIVSDGWSISVLIRELAALYEAFSVGKPGSLPELPIQYADFTVWQRQWLQGEALAALIAYWKKQLGNNLPVLQLPTIRPRAEVHTNQSGTSSFVIPPNLSFSLQTLSRSEGATLFMTLLAGFQVLLQRYTHQDDIVVGTDVANRNRAETEPLIGFFINLLVLRTDMSGNPSFRDLLKRVREVALGAYAHQDLPFDKLVKALQPERNLSHTPPLFQVLFVLQNTPNTALKLPGLTLNLLEVEYQAARFDLALFLTETDQGIVGNWQCNADLFDAKTLTRMTEHFLTLLNGIVAQPDARINTFKMLTDEEIEQQAVKRDQNKAAKLKRFMTVQPQAINLSQEQLIKTDCLQPGEILPLVTTPNIDNIDIVDWVKNNREFIETKLLYHGAILFRNFDLTNSVAFENFAEAICPGLFGEYGDLPREGISGKVYGSTPYPAEQAILFHNESSHMHCWPQKIWFFCIEAAQQGGETPIVDCRKVFRLLDAKVREKFEQKQLMYVRNFTDSLDVSWQEFFHTTDRAEVEEYCRQAAITCEWKPDRGLKTRQIRPAIIKHTKTGETVFFNQIQLHHPSYLAPDVKKSLLSLFGEENLPRHVYYGDGSPIEDSVIAQISAVYQEATVAFPWQQGDVLMLDNMLTAHGRNPYIGSRKIVVAMGEIISNTSV